jgi:hypothetical protein
MESEMQIEATTIFKQYPSSVQVAQLPPHAASSQQHLNLQQQHQFYSSTATDNSSNSNSSLILLNRNCVSENACGNLMDISAI